MTKQRVSLVLPAYNEATHLRLSLDSIMAQTVQPYEVIVVDNNSTDETAAIAHGYPGVRVIQEPRQGKQFARNCGFDAARGDIIGRIDADTVLPPDWIANVQAMMERSGADAITGKGYFYDAAFSRVAAVLQPFGYQHVQRLISGTYTLWGSNMAMRRAVWRDVGIKCSMSHEIDEDIDLTLRMQTAGHTIAYEPGLSVGASLRRGQIGFMDAARYLSSWPKNYQENQRPRQAFAITVLTLATIIVTAPMTMIVSMRQRLGGGSRIVPGSKFSTRPDPTDI